MIIQKISSCPRVIVRSWGDEPVELRLYSIGNKTCYVGQSSPKRTIGLPSSEVFAFDESLFSSLKDAYMDGNRDTLSTLYARISVDDFACNRYQDMSSSLHD